MSDDAELLSKAALLPLEQRVEHKNWKVRNAAYEDMTLKCRREGVKSEEVKEFGTLPQRERRSDVGRIV